MLRHYEPPAAKLVCPHWATERVRVPAVVGVKPGGRPQYARGWIRCRDCGLEWPENL